MAKSEQHALTYILMSVVASFRDPLPSRPVGAVQMLADLGLSVYVEDFEKPFLTATSEFYMVSHRCCCTFLLISRLGPGCSICPAPWTSEAAPHLRLPTGPDLHLKAASQGTSPTPCGMPMERQTNPAPAEAQELIIACDWPQLAEL